tara:strand:+ start:13 stop:273 length:261 start_codon:yes stop_codon:yes gene_type:complete
MTPTLNNIPFQDGRIHRHFAMAILASNPGLTVEQWYEACGGKAFTFWHNFKYHVSMVLMFKSKIRKEQDLCFVVPVDGGFNENQGY